MAKQGAKSCLFCGERRPMSNEHIFPKWILRHFDQEKDMLRGTHATAVGFTISERKLDFSSLVSGGVCKVCNNGWMAQLEGHAKAVLTPLFSARKASLAAQETFRTRSHLIARWSLKTAAVLNYSSNYRATVPAEHFRCVFEGVLPQFVFARAGFSRDFRTTWHQSQDALVESDPGTELPTSHYRISLQLGHLLLCVAYFPSAIRLGSLRPHVRLAPKFKASKSGACLYDDIEQFDIDEHLDLPAGGGAG